MRRPFSLFLRRLQYFFHCADNPPTLAGNGVATETSGVLDLPGLHLSERPVSPAHSNHLEATEVPCVNQMCSQSPLNHVTSELQILTIHPDDPTGVAIPAPLGACTDVGPPAVLPPAVPLKRSKQNIFALIIGINDYTNCQKLRGAVADAKSMKEYLEKVLRVPEDRIRTLFDHEATRNAIIKAFKDLQSNEWINEGDPIVIFYAGHGGELPAPTSWTPWGVERKIQCLLPQDYESSNIPALPDRTIGALIESIAKAKGNNICVIFDCCHAASGTRIDVNNEGYVPRTVRLDSIISADLDRDIWGGRSGKIHPGFACHGLQSHILLAACGEKELAYEYGGHGQFTTALLETLKTCAIDDLTYDEILEQIHLNKQNPHCEGFNQHRVVFDARVPAGRQVRYSVRIDNGGRYVIGAGLAQGISPEVEFTLYSDQKRILGSVVVDDAAAIEDFQTTITTSKHIANPSFAKLTRIGNLPLYLTPRGNFTSVLEETLRQIGADGNGVKFRLVEDITEAELEVAMENNTAVLKILDQRLKQFGLTELSFKTTLDHLSHVLGAAAHYYWYLNLTKENNHVDTNDGVTVDFYLLQDSETEYDEFGLALPVPVEPGFCRKDPNAETSNVIDFVIEPDGRYGIKITNNTTRNLYLNAFLFNNSSLRIVPYYTQPSAGTPEAPLKQNGAFTIGYGPGGIPPFTYSLEEGRDVDVGYLKIFFATRPIDLSDIVQLSPLPNLNAQSWIDEDTRKARLNPLPLVQRTDTDTRFTLDIPIVQRRQEMPAAV